MIIPYFPIESCNYPLHSIAMLHYQAVHRYLLSHSPMVYFNLILLMEPFAEQVVCRDLTSQNRTECFP